MTLQTLCPHCTTPNRVAQARLRDKPRCGHCHQPLFVGRPLDVSDAAFNKLLTKEQLPLVVDFWAEWCGPCKSMAPVFSRVASEREPNARFIKVNTEQARQTASAWQVRSIPTLMMFRNGKRIAQQAGALPYPALTQWLDQHLST